MTDGVITEGRGDGGAQQSRLSKHKSSGWTSEDSPCSVKSNYLSQKAGTSQQCLYNIQLVNKLEDAVIFFFFTVISEDPSWILKKEPSFFLFLPHHFSLRALELLTGAERRHGDTYAPNGLASCWESSSTPAPGFCFLGNIDR